MSKPRKSQDEKDLEKLAKTLLSTPHKPRDESKVGGRKPAEKVARPKQKAAPPERGRS